MPVESSLAHRSIRTTALPYKSNVSPTETDPCYVTGSQDVMSTVTGYSERRPGFADNLEPTPTVFISLKRTFTWDRFNGSFVYMACDLNASNLAVVYKLESGTDASFVSLFTDTSSNIFDFNVSNNAVYFSNGNVAKKWDPINGISNWGITVGEVNNIIGPTITGLGGDAGGGSSTWNNPNNVTSTVSYATTTLPDPGTGYLNSNGLDVSLFGFAVPAVNTILGISVTLEVTGTVLSGGKTLFARLLKNGGVIGTLKQTQNSGTVTLGGTSDLWATTWTPNDINQAGFGVHLYGEAAPNSGTWTLSVRNVRMTIYSLGGPAIVVSGSAGTMTAVTGYQYVYCYGNSATGHISSPSPPSVSTAAFANKLNVQVSLTKSNDAQVNQIRVFRSTDSVATGVIAGTYFELPNSPFANSTANITDNAADSSLTVTNLAPIPGFNDPPPPFYQPTYFSGRMWGFKDNQVFYSGLEEITNGVPEESFVSGPGGNFWNFDEPVQGLAVAGMGLNQTLVIFCGGRLYGITGNSLDTFRRFLISNRRGCRSRAAISTLGGMVAWFDSAAQIWGTDGNSLQELSIDIRPDLLGLSPVGTSMTFHTSGRFHWLVFATPTKLYVFDMDLEQWMPPWNVVNSYVYSGETSAGTYDLILSSGTRALKLSTSAHNDNGSTYQPILKTNLFAVVPDFGKRFSYAAVGAYDEPSRTGYPTMIHVDTNNVNLEDVLICNDDDPLNSSTIYSSVFANKTTPEIAYNRSQGTNLVQNIFPLTQPSARWIGIQIKGEDADDALKIYSFFMSYKPTGGR